MNDTLMDQCRREAEERYPMPVFESGNYVHTTDVTIAHAVVSARQESHAAALYAERSKRQPTVQQVIDAAVEVFELGPEDQDDVLRFGMKVQDMEGPPMITVEEADQAEVARMLADQVIQWINADQIPWKVGEVKPDGSIEPLLDSVLRTSTLIPRFLSVLGHRLTAAATNNTNDNEAR